MLNPKLIREHYDDVVAGLKTRGADLDALAQLKAADDEWRQALADVEALKAERNKRVPKGKPSDEERQALQALSQQIKEKQELVQNLEIAKKGLETQIPNIPHETTPLGDNDEQNLEIRQEGNVPTFSFDVKSHDDIGTDLGILDFENATEIAGSRFVVNRGWGAKLERALINYMLDVQTDNGYTEVMPPVIVRSRSLEGTGQLPKFANDLFKLEDTDYWLSPTAEVQLTNLYQNSVIPETELPIRITAYTPCFRKEAGSHGKDIKGIIRLHQFNKVELVNFVTPESSMHELETLLGAAESILKGLKLPYRVVALCSGDLGFSAAKTYDLEVWFPSQNKYREISSCSNFLDFQSRRAMIRYKREDDGSVTYLHTLNGSGVAVGRALAAILENYQTEDGRIVVPDVLRPYLGVEEISCQTKS